MKNILILTLLLSTGINAMAQDKFSSVEERMTGKEFMETGLNKLTDAELEALNQWLRGHSVATMDNAVARRTTSTPASANVPVNITNANAGNASNVGASSDRRGLEGKQGDNQPIVSRIVGEFSGWDGETTFTLENGMVWKQSEAHDSYYAKTSVNPEVTIKTGFFNSWKMKVEGYNKSLQVDRLQ